MGRGEAPPTQEQKDPVGGSVYIDGKLVSQAKSGTDANKNKTMDQYYYQSPFEKQQQSFIQSQTQQKQTQLAGQNPYDSLLNKQRSSILNRQENPLISQIENKLTSYSPEAESRFKSVADAKLQQDMNKFQDLNKQATNRVVNNVAGRFGTLNSSETLRQLGDWGEQANKTLSDMSLSHRQTIEDERRKYDDETYRNLDYLISRDNTQRSNLIQNYEMTGMADTQRKNELINYLNMLNGDSGQLLNNAYQGMGQAMTGSQFGSNWANQYYQNQLNRNQLMKPTGNGFWGQALGAAAGVGGAAMMASDIRVKENIKPIGAKNGINWYEFEYKPEYNQPQGVHVGVIAQEIENIIPEAVYDIDGIKHVDYSHPLLKGVIG